MRPSYRGRRMPDHVCLWAYCGGAALAFAAQALAATPGGPGPAAARAILWPLTAAGLLLAAAGSVAGEAARLLLGAGLGPRH